MGIITVMSIIQSGASYPQLFCCDVLEVCMSQPET